MSMIGWVHERGSMQGRVQCRQDTVSVDALQQQSLHPEEWDKAVERMVARATRTRI